MSQSTKSVSHLSLYTLTPTPMIDPPIKQLVSINMVYMKLQKMVWEPPGGVAISYVLIDLLVVVE